MHRMKFTPEQKIELVQAYLRGEGSYETLSRRKGLAPSSLKEWVLRYNAHGPTAFTITENNNVYSEELKIKAVRDYLDGNGGFKTIAAKYGLRTSRTLRDWVKVYNSGKDFEHKMSGGSRMTSSRTTTLDERIKIVKDCIGNGNNYGETAIKYNVSYQQVYTWVKHFKEGGEAALEDRRGKRIQNQQPRSELEEMKIRMAQLEHELYLTRMERDLLKKLDEIERGDASHR